MPKAAVEEILELLAKALNAMPDVFSTPQWGGRAYKLPGPGSRGTKKPVLLTHISIPKERDSVRLGFRLEVPRAKAVVKQHKFIKPSTFGTLGKSGWLEMAITTKAQCRVVVGLLKESRALHPVSEGAKQASTSAAKDGTRRGKRQAEAREDAVARRLDSVLQQKREQGWRPHDDEFDD